MAFTTISHCHRVQLDYTITGFSVVGKERKLGIVKTRDKRLALPWDKDGGLHVDSVPKRDPTKLVAFKQRLKCKRDLLSPVVPCSNTWNQSWSQW